MTLCDNCLVGASRVHNVYLFLFVDETNLVSERVPLHAPWNASKFVVAHLRLLILNIPNSNVTFHARGSEGKLRAGVELTEHHLFGVSLQI